MRVADAIDRKRYLHNQQAGDDRQEAQPVDEKAPGRSDEIQCDPGSRRAEYARTAVEDRDKRDAALQIVTPNHLDGKHLSRGRVEGITRARQKASTPICHTRLTLA